MLPRSRVLLSSGCAPPKGALEGPSGPRGAVRAGRSRVPRPPRGTKGGGRTEAEPRPRPKPAHRKVAQLAAKFRRPPDGCGRPSARPPASAASAKPAGGPQAAKAPSSPRPEYNERGVHGGPWGAMGGHGGATVDANRTRAATLRHTDGVTQSARGTGVSSLNFRQSCGGATRRAKYAKQNAGWPRVAVAAGGAGRGGVAASTVRSPLGLGPPGRWRNRGLAGNGASSERGERAGMTGTIHLPESARRGAARGNKTGPDLCTGKTRAHDCDAHNAKLQNNELNLKTRGF